MVKKKTRLSYIYRYTRIKKRQDLKNRRLTHYHFINAITSILRATIHLTRVLRLIERLLNHSRRVERKRINSTGDLWTNAEDKVTFDQIIFYYVLRRCGEGLQARL